MEKLKSFELNDKIYYYKVKDVKNLLKEIRGVKMAEALMMVYPENSDAYDICPIYGEDIKVQYAMPDDAKEWYVNHLKRKND